MPTNAIDLGFQGIMVSASWQPQIAHPPGVRAGMADLKTRESKDGREDRSLDSAGDKAGDGSLADSLTLSDYREAGRAEEKRLAGKEAAPSLPEVKLDDSSKPRTVAGAEGAQVEIDQAGRLCKITSKDGTSRGFTYDEKGRVTEIKEPDGTSWRRHPDYPDSNRFLRYDKLGRADYLSEQQLNVTTGKDGSVTIESPYVETRTYTTDGVEHRRQFNGNNSELLLVNGRASEIKYSDGTTRSFAYSADGKLSRVKEPDGSSYEAKGGDIWEYRDRNGRVSQVTRQMEVSADGIFSYKGTDGFTHQIDTGKQERAFRENADLSRVESRDGRVASITYADGSSRSFTYNQDGSLSYMTMSDGTYWVNLSGRQLTGPYRDGAEPADDERQGLSNVKVMADGSITYEDDRKVAHTIATDGVDRSTNSAGSALEMVGGLVTKVVTPDGRSRSFEYSKDGSISAVTEPDGTRFLRESAGSDRFVAVKADGSPDGEKEAQIRKDMKVGRDGTLTYQDGEGVTRTFLVDGPYMRGKRNADGSVVESSERGGVTQVGRVTYPDGSGRQFRYDYQGKLYQVTEPDGATFTRNSAAKDGNEWTVKDRDGNNLGSQWLKIDVAKDGTVTFEHKDGKTERITTAGLERGGARDAAGAVVEQENGRPTRITYQDGSTREFGYDKDGKLDRVVEPAGDKWIRYDDVWMHISKDGRLDPDSRRSDIAVEASGLYRFKDGDDVEHTYLSDGSEMLKLPAVDIVAIHSFARDNFDSIDSDEDGYLSKAELAAACQDPQYRAGEAIALGALLKHLSDFEELNDDEWGDENDGITRKDLEKFWNLPEGDETLKDIVGTASDLSRKWELRFANSTRALFAHGDNPLKDIRPDGATQGGVGDCYFVAALSSLASVKPEAIKDMIRDNGDGTYTVTFPGARDEPITVAAPSDLEMTLFAAPSKHGYWAAVLEKAYGIYCSDNPTRRTLLTNPFGSEVAQENADGGSMFSAGLRILTGKEVDNYGTGKYDSAMRDTSASFHHQKLSRAFKDRTPVTAKIKGDMPVFGDGKENESGLMAGHEYSVLEYDDTNKRVRIRNPLAVDDGKVGEDKKGGEFWLSLDDFLKYFDSYSVARRS